MSEMTGRQDGPEQQLRRIYRSVVFCIILMYFFGAIFYADPFHFWQHALSELGTTKTLLGTPNLTSALIITTGMFITGRLLLEAARVYRYNDFYTAHIIKSGLLYISSLGAFIAISPNDLMHTIHTIGSAFLVGGIFLVSMLMVWDSRAYYSKGVIYLIMILLGIAVLLYAVTYFSGSDVKQVTQKICLISLLIILFQRSRIRLNRDAIETHLHLAQS
jgi:hypothetical membrane protein